MNTRRKLLQAAAFLPALAWYGVIWSFSAQNADSSGELSDRTLFRLLCAISNPFRNETTAGQTAIVEFLSFYWRKAAHMFLYFVLTGLLLLAFWVLFKRFGKCAAFAIGSCALLAAADELHQRFVPGRSCELRDVLVDTCGGAVFLLLAWVTRCVLLSNRAKKTG